MWLEFHGRFNVNNLKLHHVLNVDIRTSERLETESAVGATPSHTSVSDQQKL